MPNAINRIKANLLVKVEKENENNNIKRKSKTIQKDKLLNSREETVWERLSKVKRTQSYEDDLSSTSKSRHTLISKSSHRLLTATMRTGGVMQKTIKKPLSPITNSNKQHFSAAFRRIKDTRPLILRNDTKQKYLSGCRPVKSVKGVQEILTARSISNSKSSSEGSRKFTGRNTSAAKVNTPRKYYSQSSDFNITEADSSEHNVSSKCSQDSADDFIVAPLISVPTRLSINSSIRITNNFEDMLEKRHCSMAPEELNVIKSVVKTDERCSQLQHDDSELFRDILKSQLQQIIKQEMVVKTALKNLEKNEFKENIEHTEKAAVEPVEKLEKKLVHKKPQVDVIFKNVPTLEKEIVILKALGEKLEATLRRTVSFRSINSDDISRNLTNSQTSLQLIEKIFELNWILGIEHIPQQLIRSLGIRLDKGYVLEFRIAHKTIVELKEEANRHFYLPLDEKKTELKRTNFKKLKETPDILMRHLKPKNSLVPFNVLEQDSIFFNSFLFNTTTPTASYSHSCELVASESTCPEVSSEVFAIHEGGDSSIEARISYAYYEEKQPLKIEEIRNSVDACTETADLLEAELISTKVTPIMIDSACSALLPVTTIDTACSPRAPITIDSAVESVPKSILFESPIRGKRRRRIRRSMTPMPLYKDPEPKHNVLKTIIVGSMQISIFLLLIMAITYPDIKC